MVNDIFSFVAFEAAPGVCLWRTYLAHLLLQFPPLGRWQLPISSSFGWKTLVIFGLRSRLSQALSPAHTNFLRALPSRYKQNQVTTFMTSPVPLKILVGVWHRLTICSCQLCGSHLLSTPQLEKWHHLPGCHILLTTALWGDGLEVEASLGCTVSLRPV